MSDVRVTVTTEVIEPVSGRVITSVVRSDTQSSGNPLFITRTAHGLAVTLADDTRTMLQPHYGETAAAWSLIRAAKDRS